MACRGFVKYGICAISVLSSLLAGLFWRSFWEYLSSEFDQSRIEELEAALQREARAAKAARAEVAAVRKALYQGAAPAPCPACRNDVAGNAEAKLRSRMLLVV
eukprot:s1075_g16.t1